MIKEVNIDAELQLKVSGAGQRPGRFLHLLLPRVDNSSLVLFLPPSPALGYCVVADGGVRLIGHGVGGLMGAGYQRNNYTGDT